MSEEHRDIVVITVVPRFELPGVLRAFGVPATTGPRAHVSDCSVWFATLPSQHRFGGLTVAITVVVAQGNVDASSVTGTLIDEYGPEAVLLIGTACGIRGKVGLGDVIVADSVHGYESERREPERTVPRPQIPGSRYRIIHDAIEFIPFANDCGWTTLFEALERETPEPDRPPAPVQGLRQAHDGVIASGEGLLADGSLAQLRTQQNGRIIGGDKESLGVATTAYRKDVPWLVVRGVSDYGDKASKDGVQKDKYHVSAVHSAAAFARTFLEHKYMSSTPVRKEPPSTLEDIFKLAGPLPVTQALVAAATKDTELVDFVKDLSMIGIGVIATPMGSAFLTTRGSERVRSTWEFVESPEIPGMRATLHPRILAAIAAGPSNQELLTWIGQNSVPKIGLVVISSPDAAFSRDEEISVLMARLARLQTGGPGLLRWSIMHWRSVAVVTRRDDYPRVLSDLRRDGNRLGPRLRASLFRSALDYLHQRDAGTARLFNALSNR